MTTKNFKVVKSKFYINGVDDWGHHTQDITTFNTLNEAREFCKKSVSELCTGNECLEIHRCFNEADTVYVEESYTL